MSCLARIAVILAAVWFLPGCKDDKARDAGSLQRLSRLQDEVARQRVQIEKSTTEVTRLRTDLARRDEWLAASSRDGDQQRKKIEHLQRTLELLRLGLADARRKLAQQDPGHPPDAAPAVAAEVATKPAESTVPPLAEAVAKPAAPTSPPPTETAAKPTEPAVPPPAETAATPAAPTSPPSAETAATPAAEPAAKPAEAPAPKPAVNVDEAVPRAVVLIEGDRSSGTGFLVNQAGHVFLYTAAHVLSGNDRLVVKMNDGAVLRKFGGLAAAEGADLVRLEVLDAVKDTDTLALAESISDVTIGTPIIAWGNGGGAGVVAREQGKVLGFSADSLEVDAAIIQGNSGGPVVRATDGKVLGVVTHLTAGRGDVWAAGTRHAQVRRFACRLDREWQWKGLPVTTFLQDAKRLEGFDRITRLSFAMAALEPSDAGLRLDLRLPNGVTAAKIIEENGDAHLVKDLLDLNKRLGEKKTKTSGTDWHRQLRGIIDGCLAECGQTATNLTPERMAWFHRHDAELSLQWRKNAVTLLRERSDSLR